MEDYKKEGASRSNEEAPWNEDNTIERYSNRVKPQEKQGKIAFTAEYLAATGGGEPSDHAEQAARLVAGVAGGQGAPIAGGAEGAASILPDGRWAYPIGFLLYLVGGEIISGRNGPEVLAPGPGHSAYDRSMSVAPAYDTGNGFVVHSYSTRRCTTDAQCVSYVNDLIDKWRHEHPDEDYPTSGAYAQATAPVRSDEERIASAKRQWNKLRCNSIGRAGYDYFASRALELPNEFVGRVVAYDHCGHWYCHNGPHKDRNGLRYALSPLLVYACRDVVTDEGRAIQHVRMPHIGKRPERKVKGCAKNAAIKLTPHAEIIAARELAIGEGFETCLAAMALGFSNVWSVITASNIASFPLIDGVERLTILCEHDDANKVARDEVARRWIEAGRRVFFAEPEHGKDHNDELIALRAAEK